MLILALTLFLSGCKVDNAEYYRERARIESYELEVEILKYDIKWINTTDRYSKIIYRESYKEEYIFEEETVYAYCEYESCRDITREEYEVITWQLRKAK